MLERADFREILKVNPLLAILRNVEDGKLEQYVQTVMDGGVSFFEVALNSKNALGQIRKLKERFQNDILVGAGTVITEELAKNAMEAGADFLLSPSTDIQVLKYCDENQIAFLPGAMTPSEVTTCMSYGYRDIKLFPAGEMPMSYVKSLKGPLDGTEYVAIGGVNEENIQEFFKNGYIGVGLGSNMMPKDIVEREEWNVGTEYVRELVRKIGGVRS
ncbi:bifunctional 4-hydroxy-2-oxoglutarate aldolase/2-dehydro-3-deoxy-phosphogluconate aldolase [Mediterraneibacter sp. NSJ-55]|uniref:Bifunctional 4-hydroxy-2-oxoglutarate aldolase/2-dehydro-3-deoxy-phosphogluconate aldolase n=1 Tax=Mediterraneibacter hominis TaxID=2763054 RepID=A0A923LJH1_9FIRM|nr:bifunctional 4-hydroxy-2-oxoglutarate aldolase/2-dehydro-3-deoxy-phosphogluconate aldolase [Mediterraneibacter hominis]MBC5689983.1 bifunctional 4-hydroxy-2-oxoglutarate aldolase/2-dehydro-3-deoxy-phosphogluconate aldolase [Mediterraneibacter hominis]